MMLQQEPGFLEDLLYFNALVLWDCIPEQESYDLYDGAWTEFSRYSPLEYAAEKDGLGKQRDDVLSRINLLDMILPVLETVHSAHVLEKPLATISGSVSEIEGLRMVYDETKSNTSVFIVVPPGVTDGKAFAAAFKRKRDALHRYRKYQFELYYRIDMRIRALDLVRICKQMLPILPLFKAVAKFDRRISDEGGRPRNWYREVLQIGLSVGYFSSNRQNKSIGDLQDYIAEKTGESECTGLE